MMITMIAMITMITMITMRMFRKYHIRWYGLKDDIVQWKKLRCHNRYAKKVPDSAEFIGFLYFAY